MDGGAKKGGLQREMPKVEMGGPHDWYKRPSCQNQIGEGVDREAPPPLRLPLTQPSSSPTADRLLVSPAKRAGTTEGGGVGKKLPCPFWNH